MRTLLCVCFVNFLFARGNGHSNSTQTTVSSSNLSMENTSTVSTVASTRFTSTNNFSENTSLLPEIQQIFHQIINSTQDVVNISAINHFVNSTSLNNLTEESSNYSLVAEAMLSVENFKTYRLEKTAAIAAGVFLVSAVIGYTSCVGYRRYKQKKYGDKQRLAPEDIYDTSDLRYFEI